MYKEKNIEIYNNKVNKRILLFSDIHYTGYKDINKLEKLLKTISKYKIDFICIPGDIVENIEFNDNDYLVKWFRKLSLMSTIIISLGNHDISKKKEGYINKKLWDSISNIPNIYLLNNKGITLSGIYFYGLTNSIDYYYKYNDENEKIMIENIKDINRISNKNYNILLCHSPIFINSVNEYLKNYDLIFSGHMHNGLVLPLIDEAIDNNKGLISPSKKIFPNFARGIVKNKYNITIISGAITKLSKLTLLPIRIFNGLYPSSIEIIELKKGKGKMKINQRYFK